MLSGIFSKLKSTSLVQNIQHNYTRLRKQINKKMDFLEILPNVYHISYPEQETLKQLKTHIAQNQFQIWNISEYHYQPSVQNAILQKSDNGEIHHLCYEYYSNLPLYQLIIAINSIHYFLELSPNHRVYLHCQDNHIRSSVFLVCFIYKFKSLGLQQVSEAISYVNGKLGTSIEAGEGKGNNYNNFHTFFKNFINYVNNPLMINPTKLELLKIMINQAPKLTIPKITTDLSVKDLKVLVQVRCRDQIVTKGTFNSTVFEGDSLCLDLSHRTIILGDDFIALIKYVYQGNVYSMMRIQLNTNFVYDKFFRAHQQSIDLSSFCGKKGNNLFIDFIFEENHQTSDLAKLQLIHPHSVLKIPKKHQPKTEKDKLKTEEKQNRENTFDLLQLEEEEHQVDQHQINMRIEEVMKNINIRQAEAEEDKKQEEKHQQPPAKDSQTESKETQVNIQGDKKDIQDKIDLYDKKGIQDEKESQQEQSEEDLDDYLSKLQSQA